MISIERSAPVLSPVDAYKTLGLHPRASRDLVEAVYWLSVARVERDLSQSRVGVVPRLRALNECYEMLNDPDRRAAYDVAHGLDRRYRLPLVSWRRSGLLLRGRRSSSKANYYEILHVDVAADPAVIELAHQVRRRQLRGRDAAATFESSLVEQAFNTLKDPADRSQYDRKIKLVIESTEPGVTPPAVEVQQEVSPAAPAVSAAADGGALHGPEAPMPVDAATVPARKRFSLPKLPHRSERVARAGQGEGELRIKSLKEDDGSKFAERARLRELGLIDAKVVHDPAVDHVEEVPSNARFVFTEGPLAGRRVGLVDGSLIIGSSDTADVVLPTSDGTIGAGHARVWCRDGEYILHQLDTFTTTYVNGERLNLRLIILEPGDEIAIGQHTFRFERIPVAAR